MTFDHFVQAQDPIWSRVIAELTAGAKRSHWMWFVFPELAGLGSSPMAVRFALASHDAAAGYLDHPLLGPRLHEATGLMLRHQGRPAEAILGGIDAMKFRSSMTLFRAPPPPTRCSPGPSPPSAVAIEPGAHLRMLLGGVVVEDDVDGLVRGSLGVQRLRKRMNVVTDDGAVEDVQAAKSVVVPCRL